MQKIKKQNSKNKFGQYFTPRDMADFMIDLANVDRSARIMEPSCGEGVFLDLLKSRGYENVTAYEIDASLANQFDCVHYESFVSAKINEKFDLIIGNPPYIRWKNLEDDLKEELARSSIWNLYFNSLCDYLYIFILKSVQLLSDGGQLVFICPEYWINTAHSASLRNYMTQHGFFEEIYHFNETPVFEGVTSSIIVFKFVKGVKKSNFINVVKFQNRKKLDKEMLSCIRQRKDVAGIDYLSVPHFKYGESWLLQDAETQRELKRLERACQKVRNSLFHDAENHAFDSIGDVCDIGNGMVSGLDKAFQITEEKLNELEENATLDVVKAKDLEVFFTRKITKYIMIHEGLSEDVFREKYPNFYKHLLPYKESLEKRYQYNREINYWEWVFLRNFKLFSRPEKRIFVPCKERVSNKNYFRFALADEGIYPTQDVTAIFRKPEVRESLEYVLAYLNQSVVFEWLRCNGVNKGNIVEFSERPIASIPFRRIDWANQSEVALHDSITARVVKFLATEDKCILMEINHLFDRLLEVEDVCELQKIG